MKQDELLNLGIYVGRGKSPNPSMNCTIIVKSDIVIMLVRKYHLSRGIIFNLYDLVNWDLRSRLELIRTYRIITFSKTEKLVSHKYIFM